MFNSYKINVLGYGYQEWNRVDKHDVSCQSYLLIHVHKHSWYVDIVRNDSFRTSPNRFASDGSKVRSKYLVSIGNVVIRDRAVFKHIETYHSFEITRRWSRHHAHEMACCRGTLNLLAGKTFKVGPDCSDMWCSRRQLNLSIIDQQESSVGIVPEV